MLKREKGFSLIELLIVVAIIGIIAAIAVPQLMNAMDRGRQRRSMADMRNIATAGGTMRVDTGAYPLVLADLSANGYMQVTPSRCAKRDVRVTAMIVDANLCTDFLQHRHHLFFVG